MISRHRLMRSSRRMRSHREWPPSFYVPTLTLKLGRGVERLRVGITPVAKSVPTDLHPRKLCGQSFGAAPATSTDSVVHYPGERHCENCIFLLQHIDFQVGNRGHAIDGTCFAVGSPPLRSRQLSDQVVAERPPILGGDAVPQVVAPVTSRPPSPPVGGGPTLPDE